MAVEARGSGFLGKYENDPRLPKILFEAHIFSRETGGRYNSSNPNISSPAWDKTLYKGGLAEHDRLREAAGLDFDAAYRSASWGLFQIMGLNHEAAGYPQLRDFIGVQFISEGMQLQCGINFILTNGLERSLQAEDWPGFARGYNGPQYAENRYDEKLADAFERFKSGSVEQGDWVKKVQAALNRVGFNLMVDGIMGPRTEASVREFQEREGLTVDGMVGPETKKALGLS
jgi:hypothetical protein